MSEWKEYFLSDVYDFASGLSKGREDFGFGYGFLSYMNIFDNYFVPDILDSLVNSSEKERYSCSIKRGDVFLTRTSETDEDLGISSVALKDYPDATFNGFTKRLRPKGNVEILPEYAGFYFRSPKFRATVGGMSSMTTRASLNNGMLSRLSIILPSIQTQTAIINLLFPIHQKINLLHRQNTTLEKLAQSLFYKLFGKESINGIDKSANELIDFSPREPVNCNREYIYYDMKCLSTYSMEISDGIIRKIKSGTAFRNEDTLLAKITPCLENGKTGFVMGLKKGEIARGSTEFIVMRAKEKISPFFVYCLARSEEFRNTAILSMTGTSGRQRVQPTMLYSFLISYTEASMNEFHLFCLPLFAKVQHNQLQIRNLTHLRNTLSPKLISGEVQVNPE